MAFNTLNCLFSRIIYSYISVNPKIGSVDYLRIHESVLILRGEQLNVL